MLTAIRPGGQLGPQPAARRFRPSPSEPAIEPSPHRRRPGGAPTASAGAPGSPPSA